MTKLAGALPKGERNGLTAIDRKLVDEPWRSHIVIGVVDCKKITTDTDTGDTEATARVTRIEVIHGEDLTTAEQLMLRAVQRRNGETVLPLEVQGEIEELFATLDVNPDTGEVKE